MRPRLIAGLAAAVDSLRLPGSRQGGIDSVDGAGKTRFADELAAALEARGRPVVRAGIDSFHHPRLIRRHVEGQRHYLALCRPEERATAVVDNADLHAPYLVRCHDGRRVRQI
ncbi:MAG: hypothetical protein ACRDSN_08060 [Pseudonocardiaceae bacterium]